MKLLYGLLLLVLSAVAIADSAEQVRITEPFARSAQAHQKNSAVFMTIVNEGADSAVVAARSPVAEVVELHTHRMDNGVMRMRRIEQIDLPSAEQVMLQPGGLHVMLIGLKQSLQVDSEISLTLVFADGSERSLMVPVVHVMRGQGSDHGMGHEQGHGMKHGDSDGMGHGKGHGKGHGENYEHGKGYKHAEGYEHGDCHARHHGEGHGKGHGKGHGENYQHGEGHEYGEGYEHGKCHGEGHAEGHGKGQMNHD